MVKDTFGKCLSWISIRCTKFSNNFWCKRIRFGLLWIGFDYIPKDQNIEKNKQNNIKNNTMFWGLPGSSHVQTSLENIVFLFLFLCGFNQFI